MLEVTEAEKVKYTKCKDKGGHPTIVCKRSLSRKGTKGKVAADDPSCYTIERFKKVIEYWGVEPIKPCPKNKGEWAQAAWNVVERQFGSYGYEFVRDKIHWAMFAPEVQNRVIVKKRKSKAVKAE